MSDTRNYALVFPSEQIDVIQLLDEAYKPLDKFAASWKAHFHGAVTMDICGLSTDYGKRLNLPLNTCVADTPLEAVSGLLDEYVGLYLDQYDKHHHTEEETE